MKVNVVSETEFFPKGQGVHSAYVNMVEMLRENGVEVLINSRFRADVTHSHTIGPLSFYYSLRNHPNVISAHVIPDSFLGSLVGAKYWYWEAKKYLAFFYNRADLVLAVAPKVKEELIKIGVKKRIEVFPNPINRKVFLENKDLKSKGRLQFGFKKEDRLILGVGQVQPRKGVEDFIATADSLPDYKFLWVGGRPFKKFTAETEKLDHLLKNKPKNLSVIDNLDYQFMPLIYNSADLFFFPSYQENAPMAVIEAASCGLPLIMRSLEEYRLLYPKGSYLTASSQTFVENIKMLTGDEKAYAKAKQASQELAHEFSFQALGPKLINFYQELL